MIAEIAALALACAPNISPTTLNAVIKHESAINPYAIGVNDKSKRLSKQPKTLEEAIEIAKGLIDDGVNFDAGLGQINVKNWNWLGLNESTVFEPCTNLKATEVVLSDCYVRALKTHTEQQEALKAALSCYNTGNFKNGLTNGYVNKVISKASNVVVPAIDTSNRSKAIAYKPVESIIPVQPPKAKKSNGKPDGFAANLVVDGFLLNN